MLETLFSKVESIKQVPISADVPTITEITTKAFEVESIPLEDVWQLLNVDVQRQPELAAMILASAEEKKSCVFAELYSAFLRST